LAYISLFFIDESLLLFIYGFIMLPSYINNTIYAYFSISFYFNS